MKKYGQLLLISSFFVGILFGCQRDLPRPKTESKLFSFHHSHLIHPNNNVSAANADQAVRPSISVQFETKGHNLFVECIVSGITFRESNELNQRVGKMKVWVDGKKKQDITAAAFVIKSLPTGRHLLKLEVVGLHNEPYGLSKEFTVNIPEK